MNHGGINTKRSYVEDKCDEEINSKVSLEIAASGKPANLLQDKLIRSVILRCTKIYYSLFGDERLPKVYLLLAGSYVSYCSKKLYSHVKRELSNGSLTTEREVNNYVKTFS